MKKTYEPETKSAIEQVIDVFNDYIRTSTHFELLWSDKVGYIYISIDNVQRLLHTAAFYPKRLDEVEKIMERVSPELVDDSFRMLIRTFREAVKRR